MPFVLFHNRVPHVAEKETRTLILKEDSNFPLPTGDYSFLEMFCDEDGCDCRRVLFMVVSSRRPGIHAVINWGWESERFYGSWMRGSNSSLAKELKGPALNFGSPQSDLAPAILEFVEKVLLEDKTYRQRIKRHYQMFRNHIDLGKGGRRAGHGR